MKDLRKKVNNEFSLLIKDITEEIKRAQEAEDGFDTLDLWNSTGVRFNNLATHFDDAEERYLKNKKNFVGR